MSDLPGPENLGTKLFQHLMIDSAGPAKRLYRNAASQLRVKGFVNFTHSAASEQTDHTKSSSKYIAILADSVGIRSAPVESLDTHGGNLEKPPRLVVFDKESTHFPQDFGFRACALQKCFPF